MPFVLTSKLNNKLKLNKQTPTLLEKIRTRITNGVLFPYLDDYSHLTDFLKV